MPRAAALASAVPLLLLLAAVAASTPPAPRAAAAEGGAPSGPPKAEPEEKEEFRRELAEFEPFDRSAVAGSTVKLKFRLKGGARAPVLVVVFPDGSAVYRRPDSVDGTACEASFRLDRLGGRHRVSLVVTGSTGDRMAAQFFVNALSPDGRTIDRDLDLAAADTVYEPLDPEEDPLRLERVLYHRMNAFRARNRLPPLPWHEGVARAAREHMAGAARHYEETINKRTGLGILPHSIPGAGPDGTPGPTIGDRVKRDLGWAEVVSKLPPENPRRGRGEANYVSESLTAPSSSLDHKFEQFLLRKSDLRAPMLSPWATHAAGAATWRYYGWKRSDAHETKRLEGPPPAPAGKPREVLAALVFVQINDPAAEDLYDRERKEVLRAVSAATKPADRAEAYRLLGRHAIPEAPGHLAEAAGKPREPAVLAGALDGLWLCAPAEARKRTDALRVRILQAMEEKQESRAADALRTLAEVRYDVASRRAGSEGLRECAARARAILDAADAAATAGDAAGARALLLEALRRFEEFPESEEARAGLRRLAAAPPPADGPR